MNTRNVKKIALLLVVLLIAFTIPVSASPTVDVINVKDLGAIGNGTTDDTVAFQTAITQSTAQKKPVYVPYGTYKITQALSLTDQLVFGEPSGSWTSDSATLPTIKQMGSNKSAFILNGGASISGLNFDYAQNEAGTPTTYAPTIMMNGVGVRISNVRIYHPWIGIDSTAGANTGRAVLENIFISKAGYRGIILDGGWDASTLHNVEVWTPQTTYNGYFLNNGIGIHMKHNDAFRMSNVLVYAAATGIKFEGNGDGTSWGSLSDVSTDYCGVGLEVAAKTHITVSGGTFWSHFSALKVTGADAMLTVSGADMKSNGTDAVQINNGYMVTITGSNIERTYSGSSAPAVNIQGGSKVVLTANNISALQTGVVVGSAANVLMLTNNIVDISPGGTGIANSATSPFVLINNNVIH